MTNTPHKIELPHRRMEAWRWSDVQRYSTDSSGLSQSAIPEIDLPQGLELVTAIVEPRDTPMSKLAARFCEHGYIINVPAGFSAKDPIQIRHSNIGHCQIRIRLGEGAKVDVSEYYNSETDGFYNTDLAFDLAKGAKLARQIYSKDSVNSTRIVTAHIHAWADCVLSQHALAFGSRLTRMETRVSNAGTGFDANIHGAYLLDDARHCDMTSYIDLAAEGAQVRQSVKGVITDKATGVFQGKFHVRRTGQFTDAEMRHDAIMLSDTAHVKAKPELEIYADDVACAHGNTVGALDENALFYMRSRGIPADRAKALLIEAFVTGAFDDLPAQYADDFVSNIRNWLEDN